MGPKYDYYCRQSLHRRMDAALIALKRKEQSLLATTGAPSLPQMPTFDDVLTVQQFQAARLERLSKGPKAPGPDRIALHQLSRSDAMRLGRDLVRLIRDDEFVTS